MHTAVLAREIRRTIPGGGKLPDLSVWLLRAPQERIEEANSQVLSVLSAMSVKMTAKEASAKLKSDRVSRVAKRRRRRK